MGKKKSPDNPEKINRLCETCRRACKQTEIAVITSCPRYYPGIIPPKKSCVQLEFNF